MIRALICVIMAMVAEPYGDFTPKAHVPAKVEISFGAKSVSVIGGSPNVQAMVTTWHHGYQFWKGIVYVCNNETSGYGGCIYGLSAWSFSLFERKVKSINLADRDSAGRGNVLDIIRWGWPIIAQGRLKLEPESGEVLEFNDSAVRRHVGAKLSLGSSSRQLELEHAKRQQYESKNSDGIAPESPQEPEEVVSDSKTIALCLIFGGVLLCALGWFVSTRRGVFGFAVACVGLLGFVLGLYGAQDVLSGRG